MKSPLMLAVGNFLLCTACAIAQVPEQSLDAIYSGIGWFDDRGEIVSAHGAGILKEGNRYYLFGEFKRDKSNEFNGFSCYSSADLVKWRFERVALPVQADGRLGPNRVGERPKVMKCPTTGEFVMFMHTDDINYRDPAVGYATCDTVGGEYTFRGTLDHDGQRVKKWDIGVFQDDDGAGYLITHSGNLYRLSDNYESVAGAVIEDMTSGCEAPAMFKRDGLYYWLGSGLSAWERNDNFYFTATDLKGPWTKRGLLAPEGALTWNSQSSFVLPIVGSKSTTFMFMGDRWAHPRQRSAATYVWQPLQFDGKGALLLPEFQLGWRPDVVSGAWFPVKPEGEVIDVRKLEGVEYEGNWAPHSDEHGLTDIRSDAPGASLTIAFTGTRIGLYGVARPDGGFGAIQIKAKNGEVVCSSVIETYCLYDESSLKFLSPILERGEYTLTVTVLGEHFYWKAKRGEYGSKGDYVSVQKVLLVE